MSITLPTEKVQASRVNPRELILFGLPKSGKTSILTYLEDCLIIDMDDGTDFYDALTVKGRTLKELQEIIQALEQGKKKYKYIALDTITTLTDIIVPYANKLYMDSDVGKKWNGDDVRELAHGTGYFWTRKAFQEIISSFKPYCEHIIYVGHVREKLLGKEGKEFSSMEIDLEGKLRSMIPARADAVGYVHRKKNETIISFLTSEQVICGSRSKHLRNTEIIIAESDKDGTITKTYWDKVFIT